MHVFIYLRFTCSKSPLHEMLKYKKGNNNKKTKKETTAKKLCTLLRVANINVNYLGYIKTIKNVNFSI